MELNRSNDKIIISFSSDISEKEKFINKVSMKENIIPKYNLTIKKLCDKHYCAKGSGWNILFDNIAEFSSKNSLSEKMKLNKLASTQIKDSDSILLMKGIYNLMLEEYIVDVVNQFANHDSATLDTWEQNVSFLLENYAELNNSAIVDMESINEYIELYNTDNYNCLSNNVASNKSATLLKSVNSSKVKKYIDKYYNNVTVQHPHSQAFHACSRGRPETLRVLSAP